MMKSYQRRHLRAPLKESMLYADGQFVLKAHVLNISEGGLLLDELPSFPASDEVPLMLALPQFPVMKNFSVLKMQTFAKELFPRHVIRARAKMVRREALSQNLDNLFRSRVGLQFNRIMAQDQKCIEDYVSVFSSNLIYLQTLIDSYNTDEETKVRARTLASVLGYEEIEKVSELRSRVTADYKGLQWS